MGAVELTFLGTGTSQGVPVLNCRCAVCTSADSRNRRLRTAALLAVEGKYLAIDIGPDFRQQMLSARPPRLDGILVTHQHNDHVIGLDEVRPYNFFQKENMPLYCTAEVGKELRHRFAYAFDEDPYPGAPSIQLHTIIGGEAFVAAGVPVLPVNIMHGNLSILGFRVYELAYLTDVKAIPEEEMSKLQGLDVLVISALQLEPEHFSHLILRQALALIERIKPRRAYLTHMSHRIGLHEELQRSLPPGVYAAYDGLRVLAAGG